MTPAANAGRGCGLSFPEHLTITNIQEASCPNNYIGNENGNNWCYSDEENVIYLDHKKNVNYCMLKENSPVVTGPNVLDVTSPTPLYALNA